MGNIKYYLKGVFLSYSQIFFSGSVSLGFVLMLVSFFDLGIGLSGVTALVTCQVCGRFFDFNKAAVFNGAYTYNALLVGLAMGSFYEWGISYFVILIIAALLTFFLTVWISGRLYNIGLPFLSLPFLVTIWILLLGLSNFSSIKLVSKDFFSLQSWFPHIFLSLSNVIDLFPFKDIVHIYLRSLSAVIFQFNDLAGLIIAIVILLRSRMAFALSIYGFLIGYSFYYFLDGDFAQIIYSYIGFNFILTSIALGGYYLVPSVKSHLLLFFVVPVNALILSALHTVFAQFQLPLYSLPFNLIVLLMIGALQMRPYTYGLQLVTFQQYSPELNHYKHFYYKKRFANSLYYHLFLPVMGEWHIAQGHDSKPTHTGEWKHAWDFDITDDHGKTYHGQGLDMKDYYCYELPVTAPAAGQVVTIKDGIDDNYIGQENLKNNWGNTLVIKHAEGLYSKLSHLKKGSVKTKEGDYVQSGEIIAKGGSSGRSPEPHLHFQVQANPYIGSQTMQYPLAYYLVKNHTGYTFHSFDIPKENDIVRNIIAHPVLSGFFDLVAGKELIWKIKDGNNAFEDKWSVYVDANNAKYLYCHSTKASAYFYNDGVLFYFTDFNGSRTSFLYKFYTAFQKILLGHYKGITVEDSLMPHFFFNKFVMSLQDLVAPFYHFTDGSYQFRFPEPDDKQNADAIVLETVCTGKIFGKNTKKIDSSMVLGDARNCTVRIE